MRNVNEVATPKLPPPPPREAQYRSLSRAWSQSRIRPSAVTICTESRLSQVRPKARDTTPMPPPSVSPAIPTVGHEPPGTAALSAASLEYMSISKAPDPTRASPEALSSSTEAIWDTSTIRPDVPDQPA